jgi:hypothetical protein
MYRYNKNNTFIPQNLIMHLLIQHCISGHISNQHNILKLVKNINRYNECCLLLCLIFIYKAYDALPIIMTKPQMKLAWFETAKIRYGGDLNIDGIVKEINMMVEMGIMDYEFVCDYNWSWIPLKDELIGYLKK